MTYNTHTDTEIDRLVAERLGYPGWRQVYERGPSVLLGDPWSPSTRIEQAMGLLAGLDWECGRHPNDHTKEFYVSIFDGDCRVATNIYADTLPRAICEAWLAWKDAEGK